MNIQDKLIKIHAKYGTSEKANYEVQKLFDLEIYDLKVKADKWDNLDNEIGKFYKHNAEMFMELDGDLLTIGETAARALGYE